MKNTYRVLVITLLLSTSLFASAAKQAVVLANDAYLPSAQFMEKYDSFTLTAFDQQYRKALKVLGSTSGRDGDKIGRAGLTPIASQRIAAPAFAEARLIVECKKIYWQDFDPDHFLESRIEKLYPKKDYHRIYFGEILTVLEG